MKRILLLFTSLAASITYAQTSISNFNSVSSSMYATVVSTPEIDQSASGANVTWNFTNFTSTETTTDTFIPPTPTETSMYPGTSLVFVSTDNSSSETTKIFEKQIGQEISLTGAEGEEFNLNYNTDNALIGTFPLNYNYNNSDTVSGEYNYAGESASVSGTFSGNIVVTVDAYGTLNLNDVGAGSYSDEVTRLKIVQTVSLDIPPFLTNAGTATQTSYYYYDAGNTNLVFRSNSVRIVVPFLNIDETTTIYQSLLTNLLDVNEHVTNVFSVVPNPVHDVLHISLKTPEAMDSITVFDVNGRQVVTANTASAIDVSHLQAGMYFVRIQTETNSFVQKIIKK